MVRRWSGEVPFDEGQAPIGLETQRPWSDPAVARNHPVLLALFLRGAGLALQLSHGGQLAAPLTAW
jgi:hypothetical protein